MIQDRQEKYQRMNDQINELNALNENIARLAFYINENGMNEFKEQTLHEQLEVMTKYRDILQSRIINGVY